MIAEHERVVLKADVKEHGLESGDIGTVVHVYSGGKGYEVEFISLTGETAAVVTLSASQIRSVRRHEISHARQLAVA